MFATTLRAILTSRASFVNSVVFMAYFFFKRQQFIAGNKHDSQIKILTNVYNKTVMDFSGVIHDVIFAVKSIIDRGDSRGR